ncbi:hypothetical protein DIE18_03095 [Burkholderia sp. Bp9125]|nr:hypothetical protein DIE18_03095 [Burkholderia sp. Bp9125]
MDSRVKERELQKWFVEKARANEVCKHIENLDELKGVAGFGISLDGYGKKPVRYAEEPGQRGIERARRICSLLNDDEYLFQNLSVAPAGSKQMRPDIVTVTGGGSYLLVELKTQKGPERQGVQELLAYSAAIKMQAPYVNDFIFVIVAKHWDALLCNSVRALILDGKHVLPLKWRRPEAGQPQNEPFALAVMLDLFRFDFVQHYDPWFAMIPYTLATSVSNERGVRAVTNYFSRLSWQLVAECQRLLQSGFVLNWSNPTQDGGRVCSLTLVTVNQNWLFSEHTSSIGYEAAPQPRRAFDRLLQKVADAAAEEAVSDWPDVEEDDPWWFSAKSDATGAIYPESWLSADLMERHRNDAHEEKLYRVHEGDIGLLESGQVQNLKTFVEYVLPRQQIGLKVSSFHTFGELSEVEPYEHDWHLQKVLRVLRRFRRMHKGIFPGI